MSRQSWAVNLLSAAVVILTSCQTLTLQESELSHDYYNIGNAYSDLGKYEQAADYYKRALELNPDLNQAAFNLARTNLEIEDNRAALKLLENLESQDDRNLMVLEMLGFVWYKLGDHAKAAGYYKKCLSIDEAHIRSLYNLTVLEMEEERWKESEDYLDRLLALENKEEYRTLKAELADARGETDSAIIYYEDLVLEYGGSKESYTALKDLYLKSEMYKEALDTLDLLIGDETEKEVRKDLYFEKSRIEILILDDVILGQTDLISALEDGYNDRESLDELVEGADVLYRADLEKIIKDNILESEPELADEPQDNELIRKPDDQKSRDDKIKEILNY